MCLRSRATRATVKRLLVYWADSARETLMDTIHVIFTSCETVIPPHEAYLDDEGNQVWVPIINAGGAHREPPYVPIVGNKQQGG